MKHVGRICLVVLFLSCCGAAYSATLADNKALVEKDIEANNAKNNLELPSCVADNFRRHSQASPNVRIESKADLEDNLLNAEEPFPVAVVSVDYIVAEGDLVSVWGSYQATHPKFLA
jgi:hypothetical protein